MRKLLNAHGQVSGSKKIVCPKGTLWFLERCPPSQCNPRDNAAYSIEIISSRETFNLINDINRKVFFLKF